VADEVGSPLGAALRGRREERGLGQAHLAAALGVRQQTVSRWEHGLAVPRPGRVVELAALLELDPAELHRLAGYLPQAAPSVAVDDVRGLLAGLSRAQLLLVLEHVREELRSRDASASDRAEVAAG
jgi:transcriptional regulator with XRE-family HTH domain